MITVRVDVKGALGNLSSLEKRQVPFAVSLALNRVANKAQVAEMEHIQKTFKLRNAAFVLRGVKIEKADRATKSSWRVVIRLAYPDDRQFMAPHEKGGFKVRHGGKRLWQPNGEVFKGKIIGRSNPLNPKNLKLRMQADGRIQGEQRTFLVKGKGQVLILQRLANDKAHPGFTSGSLSRISLKNFGGNKSGFLVRKRDPASVRTLYRLISRAPIKARLEFEPTIVKTVQKDFPAEVTRALHDAMMDIWGWD